ASDAVAHLLSSGDHVVLADDVYGGTYRLFARVFDRAGVSLTPVDMTEPRNVRKAITPQTKLVWIETPSNPLLKIVDVKRHARNATAVAKWLKADKRVTRVYYPGLRTHPQAELAATQMRAPGGMVSFEVKGGETPAQRAVSRTKLFALAESLGGVESLLEL